VVEDLVTYEVADNIAVVTINRPDKLNAISIAMADQLYETWTRLEADDDALVAVLRAEGSAFSVGADIKEERPDSGLPWAIRIHRCFPQHGTKVFKPIVGAVQGYALGAGAILAVNGCDLTLAGESALFGYPEPRAGMPASVLPFVPGFLPFKASLEFHLLAWERDGMIDAHRARDLSMVNRVVADDALLDEALRWAHRLTRIPPHYVRALKRGHYRDVERPDFAREFDYVDFVWPHLSSQDFPEAHAALREGREPRFTGR
jgi:enoyl-CoA hydratase/carnithine racemase